MNTRLTTAQRELLVKVCASDGTTFLRGPAIRTGQVLVKLGLLEEVNGCTWNVVPTPAGVAAAAAFRGAA